MAMDFNDADRQSSGGSGEPIPDGTVAPVRIALTGRKVYDSGADMFDVEYIVTAGPYARRKIWSKLGVAGKNTDGHKTMVKVTRAFIRAVLESAYGIDPKAGMDPADTSPAATAARNARCINDYEDLNGLVFLARMGIEKGKPYMDRATGEEVPGRDRNTLSAVTPDDADYAGFTPARPPAARANGASRPAAAIGTSRPPWAQS